jgi:extracellular elastinolytic metalloproteinase
MGNGSPRRALRTVATLALALAAVLPAFGKGGTKSDTGEGGRNFDLRTTLEAGAPSLAPAQADAVSRLRASVPGLLATADPLTGATRTLTNAGGFLTGPRSGDAEQVAVDFAWENLDLLGLTAADLDDYEITDRVLSSQSGVTHLYLRQRHAGLPVYNGQLHVNVAADGRILSVNNLFVPSLASVLNTTVPALAPEAAVAALAAHLGGADLAGRPASEPQLMILPIRPGEARLVWNFNVDLGNHWYDVTVDAVDGRVWTRFDWVADATYRVYETPVEHPGFTLPAPPADARTNAVDPQTGDSPFGWHDTNGAPGAEFTTTQGNNVHAYTDTNADNIPDAGSSPDGGAGLVFTPALDLTQPPSANRPPAVVNLFYWNNIIHDIEYVYGFDEISGNFQENNYGNGGLGSDYVQAEAQDGSGFCNANFGTPADGGNPRMQMFISNSGCFSGSPARDGDLDNLVIVHEYGHGISNRLVGGPANVSCLQNTEHPGEGTSDWWGLSLTALASQTGPTVRGVGTWLFGNLFPDGIRDFPYSTDNGVNPQTYNSIAGPVSVPHGVGAVWAQGYWEAYWALVDEHGFDPDFYNFTGTSGDAGNIRAKFYLNEGLKNTVCSPGFVNVRDGILAAAAGAPYNGADTCTLWEAFAGFGLGFSASQGSSGSRTDQTEAFDLPPACSLVIAPPSSQVCAGTSFVGDVEVGAAFTPPVTMSTTGVPAPATATFSPNPVNGPLPAATTLTIANTAAVPPATYPITVQGSGGVAGSDNFNLVVIANPGPPSLLTPTNSTTTTTTQPNFTWAAAGAATQYRIEIDDDPAFGSPVVDEIVAATSFVPAAPLADDTLYYWRVSVANCSAATSAVFRFATSGPDQHCRTPNQSIPDNNPTGVTDNLVIADGGTISDLDVYIRASHTWVGDVEFRLSNGGAPVSIFNRPGVPASTFGCDGNDIDVTINDEGTDGNIETTCLAGTPTIAGNRVGGDPASTTLLAAFDGQPLADTWTLNSADHVGQDTGTLLEWCLVLPDSMPFLDGFETNDTSRWSSAQP